MMGTKSLNNFLNWDVFLGRRDHDLRIRNSSSDVERGTAGGASACMQTPP